MANEKVKKRKEGDFLIILMSLALSLFGLVMVFSASYYSAISKTGSPYTYLINDAMFVILGWVIFTFCASTDVPTGGWATDGLVCCATAPVVLIRSTMVAARLAKVIFLML